MITLLIEVVFIPLWPLGVVFPLFGTIILFYKRRSLIFWMPFIAAAIWAIARIFLMWDVLFAAPSDGYGGVYAVDIPWRSLAITGTGALAGVVLVLAALTTWVTHKVLKKICGVN